MFNEYAINILFIMRNEEYTYFQSKLLGNVQKTSLKIFIFNLTTIFYRAFVEYFIGS